MPCPTVYAKCGPVKGRDLRANDQSARVVHAYLGIPYGKPPIGKLRFAAPQRADSWTEVLQTVHTFENCPQNADISDIYDSYNPQKNTLKQDSRKFSEDCLKLNLFSPECDKNAQLPVMVWLSGGHYERHYGGREDASALSGMNNCVIVVINFRVNAFGFLSLGKDTCCPGNLALLDAILGLEWVRDNIESFGGCHKNVTLFGESSGSGMVHLLMMTSLARGLFHKAIMMSGSVLSPFLVSKDPTPARDRFLDYFNLDIKTMEDGEIIDKLRNVSYQEIMKAQAKFDVFVYFMPCVDGYVITDTPENLVKSGHVVSVPLLIGCTDSEGCGILSAPLFTDYESGTSEDKVKGLFLKTFQQSYENGDPEKGYEIVKNFYLADDDDDVTRFSRLHGSMLTDVLFVVPSLVTAKSHVAMGSPTYFYQMTQQLDFSHSLTNGPGLRKKASFVSCDHADDLYFLWGNPFIEGNLSFDAHFTQDEIELSRRVMRYFTNFARTGDPNQGSEVDITWPTFKSGGNIILGTPISTRQNFGAKEMKLYLKTLPSLAAIK